MWSLSVVSVSAWVFSSCDPLVPLVPTLPPAFGFVFTNICQLQLGIKLLDPQITYQVAGGYLML